MDKIDSIKKEIRELIDEVKSLQSQEGPSDDYREKVDRLMKLRRSMIRLNKRSTLEDLDV